MAHGDGTALGVYDVHGGAGVSARLRGHDAVLRERQRLVATSLLQQQALPEVGVPPCRASCKRQVLPKRLRSGRAGPRVSGR